MPLFKYGIDAPKVLFNCFIGCIFIVSLIVFNQLVIKDIHIYLYYYVLFSLLCFLGGFLYPLIGILRGSLYVKFREINWLLQKIDIKKEDIILDVGCGQGILLIESALRIKTGKVYGIDIWSQEDQTSNSKENTLKNAQKAAVLKKVEVLTSRAQNMPFEDDFFDKIVSSWVIHNIPTYQERIKSLNEMHRCLKLGGKIAILDISYIDEYQNYFNKLGYITEILGPRYTFGTKTYLLYAEKK